MRRAKGLPMGSGIKFVSVIIPCREEEKYIAQVLRSILANDYPQDHLEVLVVDGMSTDGTREIVAEFIRDYPLDVPIIPFLIKTTMTTTTPPTHAIMMITTTTTIIPVSSSSSSSSSSPAAGGSEGDGISAKQ